MQVHALMALQPRTKSAVFGAHPWLDDEGWRTEQTSIPSDGFIFSLPPVRRWLFFPSHRGWIVASYLEHLW